MEEPPLWSSGHSSWLQIQRSISIPDATRFLWKVMGLQWGPIILVNTTEELLKTNCCGSGLENLEYGRGNVLRLPRGTLYSQKLVLNSPTSGPH
jgi:hypothetical protein